MHCAILDTNVYINEWERATRHQVLADVQRAFVIRHSSVVLSELRRGARTEEAQELADGLFRVARIQWFPAAVDWWEAGRVIRAIGDARHWDRARRRDFQNDTLIALTARRHGATVVTTDREDFELLANHIRISVLAI